MWLTSKRPTAVRTAICSAINPPPGQGYSTGMSHPPKSTILALSERCLLFRAVFLSAGASAPAGVGAVKTGSAGIVMGVLSRAFIYPTNDRDAPTAGSNQA